MCNFMKVSIELKMHQYHLSLFFCFMDVDKKCIVKCTQHSVIELIGMQIQFTHIALALRKLDGK